VKSLRAIGAWMKVNGEAIYGTTASPFANLPWGRCTKKVAAKSTTLYLHIFNWPADGRLVVPGLRNEVTKARLLVTGQSVKAVTAGNDAVLTLPEKAPDVIASVVVVEISGAVTTP
jgi:alpha-L-fucosidase